MKVASLGGREVTPALTECLADLDPSSPIDYRELAALLACEWASEAPKCVGLAGGQGAGKSTLGRLIESACASLGLRVCVLSLDDFYLSRRSRKALARSVQPLLETRGPPGTHDILRCREAIHRRGSTSRLARGGCGGPSISCSSKVGVSVPRPWTRRALGIRSMRSNESRMSMPSGDCM